MAGMGIVRINAGGRIFETLHSTLHRFPETRFARLFPAPASSRADDASPAPEAAPREVFLDVNPNAFEAILSYLRTGRAHLPTTNDALRSEIVHHMKEWELLDGVFGDPHARVDGAGDGAGEGAPEGAVRLPDVCVVQLCDHMQHDQGVKRHAMTITFGADGFQLRHLTADIRRDLNTQLSSTYWQCYQTNERSAFFVTTKVANGTADLMTTSISQRVIEHTEAMGYHLVSSYVTLSPDVVHTSVRMLIHNFVFRRVRLDHLEPADEAAFDDGEAVSDDGADRDEDTGDITTYQNFEPRPVGPQKVQWAESPTIIPPGQRVDRIWKE